MRRTISTFSSDIAHPQYLANDARPSPSVPGVDEAVEIHSQPIERAPRAGYPALTAAPLWIDAGAEDPFQPGDQALATALRADGAPVTSKLSWPGGHDSDYWDAHWGRYLRFYANALEGCD